ncbi:hypothetical protein AGMMS49546_13660 [Spirochaetia bacterium]|nr:hypothetical protein AGMMS49546_13660 [Spirochaetia bacterium]
MAFAFLEKFFSFFLKLRDPESEKKKIIKILAKEISGNRHSRFYKPKSDLIEPNLAKFFYEMYKTLANARVFLQGASQSARLKEIAVETFLDIKYLDARQRLNAEFVAQRAQTMPITEVSRLLQEDLTIVSAAFDGTLIADADECYNQILALIQLTSFDYFSFLKKFDSNIVENNFNYLPRFVPVRGQYLCDELKNFLEISYAIDPDDNWEMPLQVLKLHKNGMDVIVPEEWKRLLAQLKEIRKSEILELSVQHIDKNPNWQPLPKEPDAHIAQQYLEDRRSEVRSAMDGFVSSQTNAQINRLATAIFGDPNIKKILYYTDVQSALFVKQNFEGFTYTAAINYLQAFLSEVFKKDIQAFCELLIIQGQWTSIDLSQELSSKYHQVMDLCEQLNAFDESLSDEGEYGSRLTAAIMKVGRDKSQVRHITFMLQEVNAQALDLINTTAQALIVICKNLKNIYDDYPKDSHDFILNWRELEDLSEASLFQQIADTYKRIYIFIQLLQIVSKPAEKPTPG